MSDFVIRIAAKNFKWSEHPEGFEYFDGNTWQRDRKYAKRYRSRASAYLELGRFNEQALRDLKPKVKEIRKKPKPTVCETCDK